MCFEFTRSPHGLPRVNFTDQDGNTCTITQNAAGALVLTRGDCDDDPVTMTRDHVATLIPVLSGFLATGRL